jgi:hypothetical protein
MRHRVQRLVVVFAGGLLLAGCEQGNQNQDKGVSAVTAARAAQVEKPKQPQFPSYRGRWWTNTPAPCPDGAQLKGTAPPAGREVWCEDSEGKRHGPRTSWWNPAVVRAILRTTSPQQRQRVEVVNDKGDAFEVDLVVADTKAGSHLKQEEGAWVHGKRNGHHVQWGVKDQLDFDSVYFEGVEQKKDFSGKPQVTVSETVVARVKSVADSTTMRMLVWVVTFQEREGTLHKCLLRPKDSFFTEIGLDKLTYQQIAEKKDYTGLPRYEIVIGAETKEHGKLISWKAIKADAEPEVGGYHR